MTVILALRSADGLVIATDSQATQQMPGSTPVKSAAVKLVRHGSHMIWAGTGAQGCNQRVELLLSKNHEMVGPENGRYAIGSAIHQCGNEVQKASHDSFVPYSAQASVEAWGGIFCGSAADGLFIAEVDPNGGWQFHPEVAATGSGYAFAFLAAASVKHHNVSGKSLDHAKALAYRAIELTCDTAAFGVGLPVQMGVVTEDGAEILSDAEITGLKETVNLWKQAEVDALGSTLAGGAGPGDTSGAGEDDDPGLDAPDQAQVEAREDPPAPAA
jgi:20S proteasome alpha/beta subunit